MTLPIFKTLNGMKTNSIKLKVFIQLKIFTLAFVFVWVSCLSRSVNNTRRFNSNMDTQQMEGRTIQPSLDTSSAYLYAIAEYIKAMSKTNAPRYDTLYIGNPDLLPKIDWPPVILEKRILLFSEEIAKKHPEENKSFLFINIAWADFNQDLVEFMFFTFYNDESQKLPFGFNPQHKSYIYLKVLQGSNELTLDREVKFENSDSK